MRLLTWHGTIIRLEAATGRLTHARLVPVRDMAADFNLALPPEGLTAPLAGPNEITLVPGRAPGTAHLQRRGPYLSVAPGPYPLFTAERTGEPETLHLLADEHVALLRDLLTHTWTRSDNGAAIQPAEMAIAPGPVLVAGGLALRLHDIQPGADPDTLSLGAIILTRSAGSRMAHRETHLRAAGNRDMPEVADAAAFAGQSPARLAVPAPPEYAIPPILGSLADRDFVYRRFSPGLPQARGRQHVRSQVVRASAKYVLLGRGVEGMIVDEHGVLNDAGSIADLGHDLPPYFSREGDRVFIDHALLDTAPDLAGPHAVVCGAGHQSYYQWLIEAMVPLSLLAPYLPPATTLLLPAGLTRARAKSAGKPDYLAALDALGFGDMKRVEMTGQICRVEELYWTDCRTIHQLPASALRAARDIALTRRPAPASRKPTRIYVRRATTRMVANPHVTESVLAMHGFTPVLMEDLTIVEQIDLFRRTEMVVAAHGAALANLLFCPAGTQVIELSPDCAYRPTFNAMCSKLGLTHAVLPCATDDGTFDGRMTVPVPRLNVLVALLLSRQAA